MSKLTISIFALILIVGFTCGITIEDYVAQNTNSPIAPKDYQQMLKKGLDVDWAKTNPGIKNYKVKAVQEFKKIGLNHARIRISNDVLDSVFLSHVDKIVNDCITNKLIPIVAYQADFFKNDPTEAGIQKVTNWWAKMAYKLQNYSPLLSFDLIIEITDELKDKQETINALYESCVTQIRQTNPNRIIFISPRVRSSPEYLKDLIIPTQHNNFVMAEFHFYASGPSKTNEQKLWTDGKESEKDIIRKKIQLALAWQQSTGLFTWVGAWMAGNYNEGNDYTVPEQVVFGKFVSTELTKNGIPFAVNADPDFYDREKDIWIESMKPVLLAILEEQQPVQLIEEKRNRMKFLNRQ